MQAVRNVCIEWPSCLIGCESLRLQLAPERFGDVLAQLPASLESLTVNITIGNFPVRILSALTSSGTSSGLQCSPWEGGGFFLGSLIRT